MKYFTTGADMGRKNGAEMIDSDEGCEALGGGKGVLNCTQSINNTVANLRLEL